MTEFQLKVAESFKLKMEEGEVMVKELTQLATTHQLTGPQLAQKWECYALPRGLKVIGNGGPHLGELPDFQNYLQLQPRTTTASLTPSRPRLYASNVVTTPSRTALRVGLATPSRPRRLMEVPIGDSKDPTIIQPSSIPTPLTGISNSQLERETWEGSGNLVTSLHPDWKELKQEEHSKINHNSVSVQLVHNDITAKSRYMMANLGDMADNLNHHLSLRAEDLLHALAEDNFKMEEDTTPTPTLESPSRPHQTPFYSVGRVCSLDQHLSPTGVWLEPARESFGTRVPLDLSSVTSYSLFPGQIIGIEGVNPTGQEVKVSKLIPGYYPPSQPHPHLKSKLKMVVAAGPFTTDQNLKFTPLASLLSMIQTLPPGESPDLLVLAGPFLSEEHPIVQSGKYPGPEAIFKAQVGTQLTKFKVTCPDVQIILIPSTLDILHPHVILPQPPLPPTLGLTPGLVHLTSNPGHFHLLTQEEGEVESKLEVLCPSYDILAHLADTELFQQRSTGPLSSSPPLTRLAQHLLLQSHLHPLYPSQTDLDLSHLDALTITHLPHLLLLPSSLPPDTQSLANDHVVAVNPGRLATPDRGGTYATVTLPPSTDDERPFAHRCQVTIHQL